MNRSLYFSLEPDKKLIPAATMENAILEVLAVPEDYSDAAVQSIAESVLSSGAIKSPARSGTQGGPVRITWGALIEKGIAGGVLEEQEA